MAIIYPRGRPGGGGPGNAMYPYWPGGGGGGAGRMAPWMPYGWDADSEDSDDDEDDESDYYGGPPGFGGGGFGPGGQYNAFGPTFPMTGHHNIYQCWPPMGGGYWPGPKMEMKDKKHHHHHHPGPSSAKKAFFLVRRRTKSGGGGRGKSSGEWKGYCEHFPAKTSVGKASNPLWYVFS